MQRLAPRVYELTDFLHRVAKIEKLPGAGKGAAAGKITYHDSCCGLRELGVQEQPRALLAKAGMEVSEMKDNRQCCGFGGTFAVKYGDISVAIVDEKCANIHDSGADAVVLGDLGCMLHIEGRLRRSGDDNTRVLHVAQVLAGDI
jgi:L-lactate dehydrogenase complex protein LldE